MGTRHLIAAKIGGAYKIAQYGQWDGYPEGQGRTVYQFLKTYDRPRFEAKLRETAFITDDEMKALVGTETSWAYDDPPKWYRDNPQFSRDQGAKILQLVADSPPLKLRNGLGFAGDSLFCEWAYVLDFDTNRLEVFKGFNQEPLAEGERFRDLPGLERTDGYHPVRFLYGVGLDELPATEREFIDAVQAAYKARSPEDFD